MLRIMSASILILNDLKCNNKKNVRVIKCKNYIYVKMNANKYKKAKE